MSRRREQVTALLASIFAREARHGERLYPRESRPVMLASGSVYDPANGIPAPVGELPPPGVDLDHWARKRAELAVGAAVLRSRAFAHRRGDVPLPDGWPEAPPVVTVGEVVSLRPKPDAATVKRWQRELEREAGHRFAEEALAALTAAVPPPKAWPPPLSPGSLVASGRASAPYRGGTGRVIVSVAEGLITDRHFREIPGVELAPDGTLRRIAPVVVAAPDPMTDRTVLASAMTALGEAAAAMREFVGRPQPDVHVHVAAAEAPDVHVTVEAAERPRVIRVEVDDDGTKRYISEDAEA